MTTNPPVGPLQAATVAYLTPPPRLRKDGTPVKKREPKKVTEDDAYCLAVLRMIRGLRIRATENTAILPLVRVIEAECVKIINTSLAINTERHRIDEMWAPSLREIARTLEISPASAHQRKTIGARIIEEEQAEAGAVKLTPAEREKKIVQAAAEAAGVTSIHEYRARHLRAS